MEPRRLLDDDAQRAAQALLRVARREISPPGGPQRAMAALGLSVGTALSMSAAAGASKAVAATSLPAVVLTKWMVAGAILGAAVVASTQLPRAIQGQADQAGAVSTTSSGTQPARLPQIIGAEEVAPQTAHSQTAESPRTPSLAQAPFSVTSKKATSSIEQEVRPEQPSEVEQPMAPTPNASSPPPSASAASAGPDTDPLSAELAYLDGARQALAMGRANEALAVLDSYGSAHPDGRMGPEAFVLRLDALVRLGRSAEARTLAQAFLYRKPRGSHADRIRALVGL